MKLKTAKSPFSTKVKDERVTTWGASRVGGGSEVCGVDQQRRASPASGLRAGKNVNDVVREEKWSRN
jgi:hypothetical protein